MKGFDFKTVTFITSVIVTESNNDPSLRCFMCETDVQKAFLTVLLEECQTRLLFQCFRCTGAMKAESRRVFLCVDSATQYPLLIDMLCNRIIVNFSAFFEESAAFFEDLNQHPRRLIHRVCPRETRKCSHCAKKGAPNFCSTCDVTAYCGTDCQRADWKTHRTKCTKIDELFHIRTAGFSDCVKGRVFKSRLLISDAKDVCSRCNYRMQKPKAGITFYKGFVQFHFECPRCKDWKLHFGTAQAAENIPFCLTEEAFVEKLNQITTKTGNKIWEV
jgi:hypothetical protein